jgi:polyisoprenoid-binding protein YceI
MKSIIMLVLLAGMTEMAAAQLRPVDPGSMVEFRVKNFGFMVIGSMKGLGGQIKFDPAQPGEALFSVTVDAKTVNTDNTMRDDHLRDADYLDAERYPHILLVSEKITPAGKGAWKFTGKLTIKDHSQPVSFPFTAEQVVGGYLFSGSFVIRRKDFGVGGFSTISDNLEIRLHVIAK